MKQMDLIVPSIDMPQYQVVLMDPPWNERGGGKSTRGAQRHYPLMKTPDIIKMLKDDCEPLRRMKDDALCYMWVTNNFLADGLAVMEAIGFRYITNIVWTKDKIGLGQYNRGQHELCLLGRSADYIGQPKQWASTWLGQSALPRTRHSRKPPEMHEMIERQWDGPYLELFATEAREGWDRWGNGIWMEDRGDE